MNSLKTVSSSRRQGRSLAWAGAFLMGSVGVWATGAVLDIVGGSGAVTRVAMLPSWWLPVGLAMISVAAGAAAARTRWDPDAVLPLCIAGVLALPFLPWLPDRWPVLQAAAGPGRYLIWLVILWLIASWGVTRLRSIEALVSPTAIFLVSTILFGTAAHRLVGTPLFPGGDEPHYLVITQSLLTDGDFKIENNHQREDYRAYYPGPLKPDYLARGVDGQIYSVHPVGLPVLAVPAFAIGGYRGVVAMLVLMAALAATLLWRWTREITGSVSAATFAWAGCALTAPYVFNSFAVYPEIPGALAVMVALEGRSELDRPWRLVMRGLAIGALPWLSTKYAPMAAAITGVLLLRSKWTLKGTAALVAPVAVAFAGWFAFFAWIWGTVSPSAPYGTQEPMTLQTLLHGAPGLLFDQEYGVVAYAPVLAVAFVGFLQMLRSGGASARRALEVMFVFGVLLVTVGAFHLWWGGSAVPGRPVASGVLLLGVPLAWCFASTTERASGRGVCLVLLGVSLAITCALAVGQDGLLLHNDRDGSSAFLDWVSPTWPVWSAFPSFISRSVAAAVERTLAWLALGAAVAWLTDVFRPRGVGGAALAALVLGFVGAVVLVSSADTATTLPVDHLPENRDRVPLLDHFDAVRRPITILYDPFSRISGPEAFGRVTLVVRPGLRTARQPISLLWNARLALPAGEYRVELTRREHDPPSDTKLALQVGRLGQPLEQWTVVGSPWEREFILPIDSSIGFRGEPDLVRSDGELRITPRRVVNESERLGRPPVFSAMRYGSITAFFHDDQLYGEPDGFWTRGGVNAAITFVSTGTSGAAINSTVRCGPVTNHVTMEMPGREEQLVLDPGESRAVAIPTIAEGALDIRVAPFSILAREGFVPAQVEHGSADRRFLGCHVEVEQPH